MATISLACSFPGCTFQTEKVEIAGAAALLTIHGLTHPRAATPSETAAPVATPIAGAAGPKLVRPRIDSNATSEEWNAFIRRWNTFKTGSNIVDARATPQLFECTSQQLGDIVLRGIPDFTSKPITEAIPLLKTLAVVPVALGVTRAQLTAMAQDSVDEPFRTFAAKVQGKAETCEFKTKYNGTCSACNEPYTGETYYTDEQAHDVLLNGIADTDIRREALSTIENETTNEIIAFVESRETARNANTSHRLAAFSQRRPRDSPDNRQAFVPSLADQARTSPCPDCGTVFKLFAKKSRGWNRTPHEKCVDCWRRALPNRRPQQQQQQQQQQQNGGHHVIESDQFGQISGMNVTTNSESSTSSNTNLQKRPNKQHRYRNKKKALQAVSNMFASDERPPTRSPQQKRSYARRKYRQKKRMLRKTVQEEISVSVVTGNAPNILNPRRKRRRRKRRKSKEVAVLSHHIFTKGEWRRARLTSHPRVELSISPEHATSHPTPVNGLADSGAQSDVWSLDAYLNAGYSRDDLQPVSLNLNAANKSAIHIDGAFFAEVSGTSVNGGIISHNTMIYVSRDVNGFYLSYSTMVELGMLPRDFPKPGCAMQNDNESKSSACKMEEVPQPPEPSPGASELRAIQDGCHTPHNDGGICNCPIRTGVPPKPTALPFPCTEENIPKMKQYWLDRYGSSTFNTCPHRPIPCMAGPPLEIHLDDDAKPYACHKASSVPLHDQDPVYKDLLKDEVIDVLEPVPHGEPVTWCHRMVITRKHDGSPRRTVDLSRLNKYCKRETHSSESPFNAARRVPSGTWKTVTDAWNSCHSVPLRESDRHLFTFMTPFGRWRYKRAPQGFLSSGDAFNRRFDAILGDFQRRERVVDDTIHYDTNLEEHWWRTIEFLSTVGAAGMILNPDKFQFAQQEVDFAGFHISANKIEPLPKYFSAIRDFPTPASTRDIQSWFGLVHYAANYAQLRDMLSPFRPFLSEKHPFQWTPELNTAFEASKDAIIAAIREGVEIFDPNRKTCLRTDWSKIGVGYFLHQKHCECESDMPSCCPDGWKITLAGSRFLQSAESRYAPIEGEALAIAWALEQTRYFTLGCPDLLLVTDHKPLTKIFGDRMLDEIKNTRIFRLKQRTLPWRFKTRHLPGKTNVAADATSRHPSPAGEMSMLGVDDYIESAIAASIHRHVDSDLLISWQKLVDETQKDPEMQDLLTCIRNGFPEGDKHRSSLSNFWRYRDALYELDGVVLYDDRVVVPPSLRSQVLNTLHAAHQGVSSMEVRARSIVFWPGMTDDTDKIRASCQDCIRNAPSQSRLPPAPYTAPSTPFEKVVADYCKSFGQHYLIFADRLSGWVDIFKAPPGSPQAGAEGLMCCLRNVFAVFGVPEELSSDGGKEFTAHETEAFFERWGIHHRGSMAYNPQSNGRAEVAVKTAKRLLHANTGPSGSLNTDKFLRAILQLRNSPDPDCNLSPAQIIFGRPLRDAFAFVNRLERYSNPHIRPIWRDAWRAKEEALRERFHRTSEALTAHSHPLPPLVPGDKCYIQNQHGNHPKRWDKSGTVVESLGHDGYNVKVDGSGRVTKRNRRYLRKFIPATIGIDHTVQLPRPTTMGKSPTPSVTTSAPSDRNASFDTPVVPSNLNTRQDTPPPVRHPASSAVSDTNDETNYDSQDCTTPVDDTSVQEEQQNETVTPETSQRPQRSRRAPLRYDAETGKWV